MWFADVVVDLPWFFSKEGKLGDPMGRTTAEVKDPDLTIEILLYGDDEAIRHLRVMMHTEDHAVADVCSDRNIQYWVNSLEVASALATSTIASAARLKRNSATFMVLLGQGQPDADAVKLNIQYTPAAKADLQGAAKLMGSWKPDFKIHLHYLSRFINSAARSPVVKRLSSVGMAFLKGKNRISWPQVLSRFSR